MPRVSRATQILHSFAQVLPHRDSMDLVAMCPAAAAAEESLVREEKKHSVDDVKALLLGVAVSSLE